ncbi:MAG: urease accessory protein UreD [Bifidobacterium tibiigranuli]|jgi:urease accessory protein|uniref:urease accessory protein UreD n=1 Tax=Bifidobacterium tibiigranuli TaxID=2172043 RepID=UPI00235681E5|nr:urease accessory protein UreD [Bifidobacterium tibiigranuli]MCH3974674.1 urease accessory protein UreD [Bifidobacterium tibiigranuli]MCH4189601.1 urease accessory protein UreD [Bifidobacterium tibiigranuli]MCH4203642.1 urease accessory protein UreD [Bifidobacterium tibiigranuli]MCH4274151.1 urease accessory protein UreD [Bifidobacterium tibiigranuli]MCI1790909.1 urease accessory protein UreD [Bifidobacterium tibiigranuli]
MDSSTFRLATALRHGRTKIDDVYFEAPFKLMTPFTNGRHSDFIVMFASPGFLQGDEAHIDIDFGPGSDATITTQSYEKVLNTAEGSASRTIDLRAQGDAKAVFLPFPVIPFRNSTFTNVTTAHIAAESTFIYADVVTCGRVGMDERWAMRRFTNRLRVYVAEPAAVEQALHNQTESERASTHRRGRPPKRTEPQLRERLAFADRMLLEPDAFDYTNLGMWREFTHCGVVYVHLPELDTAAAQDAAMRAAEPNTAADYAKPAADGVPANASASPEAIRARIESARIAAEDDLISRIRSHADAVGFVGELGVSRVINGLCVRLLTTRGDNAFDFIKDIADIVTGS